jgi:hypothetical protein
VFEIVDSAVSTTIFSDVAELKQHLAQPPSPASSRLYTLEGLPLDYLQAFGAHFNLTPDFINSHARREPYRKERWHQARDTISTGTFKYRELVEWTERGCFNVWGCKSPLDPRIKARKNTTTIVKDAAALHLTWPISARFDPIVKSGALLSHGSFCHPTGNRPVNPAICPDLTQKLTLKALLHYNQLTSRFKGEV